MEGGRLHIEKGERGGRGGQFIAEMHVPPPLLPTPTPDFAPGMQQGSQRLLCGKGAAELS